MMSSPRFNDIDKFKPAPRGIDDVELLEKALLSRGIKPHETDLFELWKEQLDDGERRLLSTRQRLWANDVLDRAEPRAENLVSRGLVPRGKEVETPAVLRNLPLKPPGR